MTSQENIYVKCTSFAQAESLIVTLRSLVSDQPIPSLDIQSKESCIRWLFFLFNVKYDEETMSSMAKSSKQELNEWLLREFGLTTAIFTEFSSNPLENTPCVVTSTGIKTVESYLHPFKPTESHVLTSFEPIIKQLRNILKVEEYNRLVQITSISYPSPLPVIRAILKRCNEDWCVLFDKDPDGFCESIQHSSVLIRKSYSFRSFRYYSVCLKSTKQKTKLTYSYNTKTIKKERKYNSKMLVVLQFLFQLHHHIQ